MTPRRVIRTYYAIAGLYTLAAALRARGRPRLRAGRGVLPAGHDEQGRRLDMSEEELGRAWDLWLTLAQSTNDSDPPYTHGVFVNLAWDDVRLADEEEPSCGFPDKV